MSDYIGFFKIDERGSTIWGDIKEVKNFIKKLPTGNYMIKICPYVENRTIHQNKFYWKLIELIANEIGYEPDEMHEVYKYKYLKKTMEDSNGNLVKGVGSTRKLNVQEFTEYIEKIKKHAITKLDLKLPENF
jgi:hypothetical protein